MQFSHSLLSIKEKKMIINAGLNLGIGDYSEKSLSPTPTLRNIVKTL